MSVTENIPEDVGLHSNDTADGNDDEDETTNSKWATVRNEVDQPMWFGYITGCFRNSMCETQSNLLTLYLFRSLPKSLLRSP